MLKLRRQGLLRVLTIWIMLSSFVGMKAAGADQMPATERPEVKIRADLSRQLDRSEGDVTFLVQFRDQPDTSSVARKAALSLQAQSRHDAAAQVRTAVMGALQAASDRANSQVKDLVQQLTAEGHIRSVQPLWIINALVVTGDRRAVLRLAARTEVSELALDRRVAFTPPQTDPSAFLSGTMPWNLSMVNAPQAWALGGDGTGVVVGILDTGVEYEHPALMQRFHGYNPANPGSPTLAGNWLDVVGGQAAPYDDVGHGTHVTGTILGYDPKTDLHIGVAPGATWIAAKAFDEYGAYDSWLLKAGQWLMAPTDSSMVPHPEWAPDVINNSWGGAPGVDEFYRSMVQNWRAAGIFPVFAAGNEGPGSPTLTPPGNYPESFAVAAVDSTRALAWFSSRGPSPYAGDQKPNISAPGVNIYSSLPGQRYGFYSGTSMATPHVAGVVADMLSGAPDLTVTELEAALVSTATPLTDANYPSTPNHGYGAGLVNAEAAVNATANTGRLQGTVRNAAGAPLQATLTLSPGPLSTMSSATDGSYQLLAKAGAYTMTASAYGYVSQSTAVTVTRHTTTQVNFTLTALPRGTLTGRVTDQITGQPISGASISVPADPKTEVAMTDANGFYSLSAWVGDWMVRVQAPGYEPQLLTATVVTGTTLNAALTPVHGHPDDWVQVQGNAAHTGYNDSLLTLPLQPLWTAGDSATGWSSTLVAGGRVFAISDHQVVAFDGSTGAQLWSAAVAGPYTPPGIAYLDGVVIVPGSDGSVAGLDAAVGNPLWTRGISRATIISPPSVSGHLAYMTSSDGVTTAIDKTGKISWQVVTVIDGTPAFGDGKLFAAGYGSVTANDAGTGAPIWKWNCSCGSNVGLRAVYADSTVMVSAGSTGVYTLYALDSASGKLRWTLDAVTAAPPLAWDGSAYVARTSGQTTQVRIWDGVAEGTLPVSDGSLIANGLLFGSSRAVDLTTGQTAWTYGAGANPVVGHNVVILHGTKLTALTSPAVGTTLSGQVRDEVTGAPLAGARVRLDGTVREAEAGADGTYALTALPGSYVAATSLYGYETRTSAVALNAGSMTRQDFSLQPAPRGTILGQVVEDGTGLPVPQVTLRLLEDRWVQPVDTGTDGQFRLDSYTGPYTLEASRPGYATVRQSVTVPAGDAVQVSVTIKPVMGRSDDWPTEYGQPDHRGQVESLAAPPFTVAWTTTGISVAPNTRPVTGNGRVYVVTSVGVLQAYDLATGSRLWSQAGVKAGGISPAFDSDRVYMISGYNVLNAYDASTGQLLWSTQVTQAFVDHSPTAVGGRVFVNGAGGGATVYALDGATGKMLWNRNFSGGTSSPVVVGGVVYISGGGPKTYAFTADTGQQLWFTDGCSGCSSGFWQQPVVGAGLVVFVDSSSQSLTAIDITNGAVRWRRPSFQGVPPVIVDGMVYAYDRDGVLERIDPQDGQTTATYTLSGRMAAGGTYLFGDGANAINLTTGAYSPGISGLTNVAVAEDLVLGIASDRSLVVLRPATPVSAGSLVGKVRGRAVPDQPLAATVTVNGRAVATDPQDGSFSLRLPPGTYTVTARAPHWLTASTSVTITAGRETGTALVLAPEPKGSVIGSLTDGFTGRPVAGARVTLAEDLSAPASFAGVIASYQLSWYAGNYTLRVEAPGYRIAYVPVTLAAGATVTANVALVPGPTSDCPTDDCSPERSGRSPALGTFPYTLAWTSAILPAAQPVLGGGMIFISSTGGVVTALNLFTGQQVWTSKVNTTNSWAPPAPAYGDGKVFMTDGNGYAYAFDALKGNLLWKSSVNNYFTATPPVYDQGRVYVSAAGNGAKITAFDANTGKQLWLQPGWSGHKVLAIGGGRVYAADYGPRIYAFDAQTGTRLWFTDESGGYSSVEDYDLTYADEVLVIGPERYDNKLTAYDARTGAHLWDSYGAPPAVANGVLYTYAGGNLNARDLHTGALQWSIPVNANGSTRPPMIVGHTLLLGNAAAIDLTTRQVVWSYAGGGGIPPTPGEGYLLVTDTAGRLTALKGAPTLGVHLATNGVPEGGGAVVTLTGAGRTATAVSDQTGDVSFPVTPSTTYQISVQKSSYPTRTMTVVVGTTPLDIGVNLTRGDFNQDGVVDRTDLQILTSAWGTANPALDLVPDGRIDLQDLYVLVQAITP